MAGVAGSSGPETISASVGHFSEGLALAAVASSHSELQDLSIAPGEDRLLLPFLSSFLVGEEEEPYG